MRDQTYGDKYADQALTLLEPEYRQRAEGLLYGQLEVLRGIGYALLAAREEMAAQLADLSDVLADGNAGRNAATDRVSDQVQDVGYAIDNLSQIVDVASQGRRGWLRWLPARRVMVITPGPGADELPAQPHPWGVTLTPAETDDVWHALADAASYRLQRLPGEGEAACGACADAAALAAEQHGPDAAAAALCPAHEQDERLLNAYSMLRMRLQGGELR